MVVDDFDIAGALRFRGPDKTYPPSVVVANAELTIAFAAQCFEPIAWQQHQRFKPVGRIEYAKPLFNLSTYRTPALNIFAFIQPLHFGIFVVFDHQYHRY